MRLPSDIEVGPVRADELDTMLEIMCEAFEMPFAAARDVFYTDPYFSLPNKRVLRVGKQVISCLTIIERECWIGESIVPLAGVAGVATRKSRRGRGYAGLLLEATLHDLRAQGYPLTALIPFSYRYYRKFGWELAGLAHRLHITPAHLPPYPEADAVRPPTHADVEALARLYATLTRGRTLHCLRDSRRWSALLEQGKRSVVFAGADGEIEGYLLLDVLPGRIEQLVPLVASPPTARVLEMRSATPAARRGLVGHLARLSPVGSIEYTTAPEDLEESGLFRPDTNVQDGSPLATVEVVPTLMMRVLNLPALLELLAPNWTGISESLEIRMRDTLLSSGLERVVVEGATVRSLPLRARREPALPVIEGDVRTWSQIVIGYLSVEDACAPGLLIPSSSQALNLASQLFPCRNPSLPAPDHF